jgi:predicted DNA-binding protein (MmcQ/YjbR family)
MSSPNTIGTIALGLADAEERTTLVRPTARVGETIFAALHDDLLILRCESETHAARLAQDRRLRPAPHWGRDGWIAVASAGVGDEELPDLLSDASQLAGGATR